VDASVTDPDPPFLYHYVLCRASDPLQFHPNPDPVCEIIAVSDPDPKPDILQGSS